MEEGSGVRFFSANRSPILPFVSSFLDQRVMMFVSFALVIVLAGTHTSRKSFTLGGESGTAYIWASLAQVIVALVILAGQQFAKYRASKGKRIEARFLLLPVFEKLLWILFIVGLSQMLIILVNSPEYPHFLYVAYDPKHNKATFADFILLFICSLLVELLNWSVFFLLDEHSLSQRALVQSCSKSLILSTAFALWTVLGVVLSIVLESPWPDVVFRRISDVMDFVLFVLLGVKCIRSSRKSLLPFFVFSCVSVFADIIVGIVSYIQDPSINNLDNPGVTVFAVGYRVLYFVCLYWTFYLDTKYWRGVTRVPIWCVGSGCSPYDDIPDSVIERDIPLLVNRPSLLFIDFAFLKFGAVVGTGATCRVYKGHVCYGPLKGTPVAIKVFTPLELSSETLSDFANEIHKYEQLRHKRVMQLVGVCVRPPDVCMVCELCEGGSLHSLIKSTQLSTQRKFEVSEQVCEAIVFIHGLSPPLIHRDIKSLNFLVTSHGDVKLSDFGTSKHILEDNTHINNNININNNNSNSNSNSNSSDAPQQSATRRRAMTKNIGSVEWMSPEVMCGHDDYDLSADIYSLGMVLWEIWMQDEPYRGMSRSHVMSHVMSHVVSTGDQQQHHQQQQQQQHHTKPSMTLQSPISLLLPSSSSNPTHANSNSKCPEAIAELIRVACSAIPSQRPNATEMLNRIRQLKLDVADDDFAADDKQ